MEYLVGLLLVLASFVALAVPFIRRPREVKVPDPLEEVRRRRLAVYEEMRSLRLDYELGRLGPDEYQARTQECRRRAALLLRQEKLLQQQAEELASSAERAVEAVSHRSEEVRE